MRCSDRTAASSAAVMTAVINYAGLAGGIRGDHNACTLFAQPHCTNMLSHIASVEGKGVMGTQNIGSEGSM